MCGMQMRGGIDVRWCFIRPSPLSCWWGGGYVMWRGWGAAFLHVRGFVASVTPLSHGTRAYDDDDDDDDDSDDSDDDSEEFQTAFLVFWRSSR